MSAPAAAAAATSATTASASSTTFSSIPIDGWYRKRKVPDVDSPAAAEAAALAAAAAALAGVTFQAGECKEGNDQLNHSSSHKRARTCASNQLGQAHAAASSSPPSDAELGNIAHEYKILTHLRQKGVKCIPEFDLVQEPSEEDGTLTWTLRTKHCPGVPFSAAHATLEWGKRAIEAIVEIHEANVLHKDLKPEHIICDETTSKVTLIDFDLATLMESNEDSDEEKNKKDAENKTGAPTPVFSCHHHVSSAMRVFRGNTIYASLHAHLGLPSSISYDTGSFMFIFAESLVRRKYPSFVLPWNTAGVDIEPTTSSSDPFNALHTFFEQQSWSFTRIHTVAWQKVQWMKGKAIPVGDDQLFFASLLSTAVQISQLNSLFQEVAPPIADEVLMAFQQMMEKFAPTGNAAPVFPKVSLPAKPFRLRTFPNWVPHTPAHLNLRCLTPIDWSSEVMQWPMFHECEQILRPFSEAFLTRNDYTLVQAHHSAAFSRSSSLSSLPSEDPDDILAEPKFALLLREVSYLENQIAGMPYSAPPDPSLSPLMFPGLRLAGFPILLVAPGPEYALELVDEFLSAFCASSVTYLFPNFYLRLMTSEMLVLGRLVQDLKCTCGTCYKPKPTGSGASVVVAI